jgi:lipoprotein NlpI
MNHQIHRHIAHARKTPTVLLVLAAAGMVATLTQLTGTRNALAQSPKAQAADAAAETANPSIRWRSTVDAAVAEAGRRGVPVLLEFTSSGCGWCKRMNEQVHTDAAVAAMLNGDFVPVLHQGGHPLRDQHHATGTPHVLVLSPDGVLLHRQRGYVAPPDFLTFLKEGRARAVAQRSHPDAFTHFAAGEEARRTKDYAAAAQAFSAAVALWPWAESYHQRGLVQHYQGDDAAALADFDAAIKQDAGHGWAHHYRGAVLMNRGNAEDAAASFRQAFIQLGESGGYSLMRWWLCEALRGRRSVADQTVAAALKERFRHREQWWERSILRFLIGQMAQEKLFEYAAPRGGWRVIHANYYAGMKLRIDGEEAGGLALLKTIVDRPMPELEESIAAIHELSRTTAAK